MKRNKVLVYYSKLSDEIVLCMINKRNSSRIIIKPFDGLDYLIDYEVTNKNFKWNYVYIGVL